MLDRFNPSVSAISWCDEPRVAGHAREIRPDGTCRAVVEDTERVFVHLERVLGDLRVGVESPKLGEGHITHDPHASRPGRVAATVHTRRAPTGRTRGRATSRGWRTPASPAPLLRTRRSWPPTARRRRPRARRRPAPTT